MNADPIAEPFGAVPHRLLRSLALGEISHSGFAILCYLTLAEDHRRGEWIGTTERMANEIGWEFTPRHLSREIKRLADDGWIESGVKPRSPKPYSLRLTRARVRRDCEQTATRLRPETASSGRSLCEQVAVSETGNPLPESASAALDCEQVAVPRTEAAAEEERSKDLDLDLDLDLDQPPECGEESAAAGSPELREALPARESEIREAVASLRGADRQSLHMVEPLANAVTREAFFELVERAPSARNPVGWLVARLRAISREGRMDEQTVPVVVQKPPAPIERASLKEALKANVQQLASNGQPWDAIAAFVNDAFGPEHVDAARATYDRAQPGEIKSAA